MEIPQTRLCLVLCPLTLLLIVINNLLIRLARWPGVTPEKKTVEWEEGLYQYFDVKVWKRIPGWFRLNYEQLGILKLVLNYLS